MASFTQTNRFHINIIMKSNSILIRVIKEQIRDIIKYQIRNIINDQMRFFFRSFCDVEKGYRVPERSERLKRCQYNNHIWIYLYLNLSEQIKAGEFCIMRSRRSYLIFHYLVFRDCLSLMTLLPKSDIRTDSK